METKFKIGDKVECIDNCNDQLDLTVGKVYEVLEISSDMILVIRNRGTKEFYYDHRFKLEEFAPPSIEEQIKLAKSYIGKRVKCNKTGITHIVDRISVKIDDKPLSTTVNNFYKKYGYAVVLHNEHSAINVTDYHLVSEFKELRLNDFYSAKVYEDKVDIGGEIIPVSVIKELGKLL